jgi:seryl-tRNA synthetase
MIELSRKARRALDGLRKEARDVQRSGSVLSARRIIEYSDMLRDDLDRLERDHKQHIKQITSGRAGEQELMAEVVELRKALEACEEDEDDAA